MSTTRDQLKATVQRIADELEFIATHEYEDWSEIPADEIPAGIDREDVEFDGEPMNLADYCHNQLDIAIRGESVGGNWEMTHVVVLFCAGGPHVEYTTETSEVRGWWDADTARVYVGCDVGSQVEELFGE